MKLTRPAPAPGLISLVPMIDVLLILLVFFMVTSSYLNLDMIPARSPQTPDAVRSADAPAGSTIMIRLGSNGQIGLRGRDLSPDELRQEVSQALADDPLTQILILPAGTARTQALMTVLDVSAQANVQRLRVLRLEGRP
ncbi:biopolymer transporter ExbD [Phaeobacter sp. B1627]|uniref:ExbD/TolR family protein n=1 Tax=Phaeobacter sp. B1627 TaxID=2583809 RepID=UPI00111B4B20|nr:biopolymer transporter ExbD [Phaeobacter sp. B1627]TNJ42325.1 biopolymer transporter ExbD [Phaeobacter sp. B1627]